MTKWFEPPQHVDNETPGDPRDRIEAELRESQRTLATLMSNLPGMAYRCRNDPQWTMEFVSEGCQPLTGYPAVDLLCNRRLSYSDLIHADDQAGVWNAVQSGVAVHGPFEMTYRIRTADGSEKWVWERGRGVFDDRGTLLFLEGFISDITERRRAEEAQARLEKQLHLAQKMEAIGQLAGGVAHDFNNILTAILGHLELARTSLAKRVGPEDAAIENIRSAEHSAERAAELTRQLLTFSRRKVVQPTCLDLNQVLAEMERMLRRLLHENITLELSLATDLRCLRADRAQIEQVVLNLVVNARDALPDGGLIRLETGQVELDDEYVRGHSDASAGAHVTLTVRDTGVGLDPALQQRIFEPFFTTKPTGKGTGLGLATVYGIVRQAGGHITVESMPGQGATFRVYWPAGETTQAPSAPPAVAAARGGPETVLLCEDDDAVRQVAAAFLRDAGYHVLVATRGAEAVRLAAEVPDAIDLLVTDVMMPDMNGLRLAETLRGTHPGLRTLFVSGYTANVIAERGVLKRGVELLEKPFDRVSLLRRVRKLLDAPHPRPE